MSLYLAPIVTLRPISIFAAGKTATIVLDHGDAYLCDFGDESGGLDTLILLRREDFEIADELGDA